MRETDPAVAWLYALGDALVWTVSILEAGLLGDREATMKKIKGYYPVTLKLDDDPITLHIRRMSTVEIDEFEEQMRGFGYSFDGRPVAAAADRANSKVVAKWLMDVISANVSIPSGELLVEDSDGIESELRTGADLVAQFGGRVDLIPTLVAFIWGENRLPENRKALFRTTAADAVTRVAMGKSAVVPQGVGPQPLDEAPVAPTVDPIAEQTLQAHDDGYEQGRLAGLGAGLKPGLENPDLP